MKIDNLKLDHSCYSYKNIWTDFDGLKFTFLIKSRKPSSFRNDKLINLMTFSIESVRTYL